ncbi:hypothetical protein K8T06_10205 [bacterium]|nr:hypothetical protein [bacterium]
MLAEKIALIESGRKLKKWQGFLVWMLALIVTLASAIYQRKTGPTHPLYGEFHVEGQAYKYKLVRDPTTELPLVVAVSLPSGYKAFLKWREYPTDWQWKTVEMNTDGDHCSALIPIQPAAGKVEYSILLTGGEQNLHIPTDKVSVIARYKDPVPVWALVPHILLMFIAMLLSNRLGLGTISREITRPELIMAAFATLTVGGLMLGPVIQQYAFGAAWTGWPIGTDLTDNKMIVSWLAWLIPVILAVKKKKCTAWVLIASLVTFAIYMIPHSAMGSEYDYKGSVKSAETLSLN